MLILDTRTSYILFICRYSLVIIFITSIVIYAFSDLVLFGLPSGEILMVVFEHVTKYITHRTQSLNRFQEFIILLIKLRLNVFQEFAYRFVVSISTVSRIFSSWMVVMDSRLSPLVSWPDRESLWRTMPISFQYAFGKQVTVIID